MTHKDPAPLTHIFLLLSVIAVFFASFSYAEEAKPETKEFEYIKALRLGGSNFDEPYAIRSDKEGGLLLLFDTKGTMSVGMYTVKGKLSERNLAHMNAEKKWVWNVKLKLKASDDFPNYGLSSKKGFCWVGGNTSKGKDEADLIYIARIDSDKNTLCSKSFGASERNNFFEILETEDDGCWVAASVVGTIRIGKMFETNLPLTGVFARFDSKCVPQASSQIQASDMLEIPAMVSDGAGGCWIAINFAGTVSIGDKSYSSGGGTQFVVAHLGADGKWLTSFAPEITDDAEVCKLVFSKKYGGYIVGSFNNYIYYESHDIETKDTSSVFVTSFNEKGEWNKSVVLPGLTVNIPCGMCQTGSGKIYVAAIVNTAKSIRNPNFKQEARLVRLSPELETECTEDFGNGQICFADLCCSDSDTCLATGTFQKRQKFGNKSLKAIGETDIFIIEMK